MILLNGDWFGQLSKRWYVLRWQGDSVRVCERGTRVCTRQPRGEMARLIEAMVLTRSV